VLVNFGGDLRTSGAMPSSGAWQVGIESVAGEGAVDRRIELKTGALATSGDTRRFIEIEGRRYVYINAFREHPIYLRRQDQDLWRSKPVLVCDGGEGFWGVLYDPEARKFSQLSFNGSA